MQKFKPFLAPLLFILLAVVSMAGGILSYLIFPAIAIFIWFIAEEEKIRSDFRTVVVGICLLLIFISWHFILYSTVPFLFILIFTFAIMASLEAWRFTSYVHPNVWGVMNLVVFWISMEYLMLIWLPFDISNWLIGAPLLFNEETSSRLIYLGKLGYSLWAFLGGFFLYQSFRNKRINVLLLLATILLIILPILITTEPSEDLSYLAQGEWVGRTCVWVSVLILLYTFVKRKTSKK